MKLSGIEGEERHSLVPRKLNLRLWFLEMLTAPAVTRSRRGGVFVDGLKGRRRPRQWRGRGETFADGLQGGWGNIVDGSTGIHEFKLLSFRNAL